MARKFLYLVAGAVVLVILVLAALQLFGERLSQVAFVPRASFIPAAPLAASAYAAPAMWVDRPAPVRGGAGGNAERSAGGLSRWLPTGARRGPPVDAVVFFIHPTSYLDRDAWNAPLGDATARERAALLVRGLSSAFGDAAEVWTPRYRQATFGAFLTDRPEARRAQALAYGDVLDAFDFFIAHAGRDTAGHDRPIVLVGHSQGALHLMRLLHDRVAGRPLARRIVAAYAIGWPVSLRHDLPAMGLPACRAASDTGCVISWQSYGEPAKPPAFGPGYLADVALDGGRRLDAPPLCSNPLTGAIGGSAPASANLGTLVPAVDLRSGKLVPGMVPARCDARGLLLLGDPPTMGPFVLPGNNYHVYDIPLFWANTRADFARRVAAWHARHAPR